MLAGATDDNKKEIEYLVREQEHDNQGEEYFWDSEAVAHWLKVMENLKENLKTVEDEISTIV